MTNINGKKDDSPSVKQSTNLLQNGSSYPVRSIDISDGKKRLLTI